jgi:hypothetical protein
MAGVNTQTITDVPAKKLTDVRRLMQSDACEVCCFEGLRIVKECIEA